MDAGATRVFVDGVLVGRSVFRSPGIVVHRGTDQGDCAVAVIVLQAVATDEQRETFDNIPRYARWSGLGIRQREDHVILATPEPQGTLRDLPWDSWGLSERLAEFKKVAELVLRFHEQDVAVGTLSPDYIVVNEDLEPFILGPRLGPRTGPYVAPETASSRQVDVASDIYTLGKLLHYVIGGEDPVRETAALPKVADLLTYPAGLVRIVRKATCVDPHARYASVGDFLCDVDRYGQHAEVGFAHPEVEEENLGVLSLAPQIHEIEEPKPVKRDEAPAEYMPLGAPGQGRIGRRIMQGVMLAIILGCGTLFASNAIRASGELEPLGAEVAAGLSYYLASAAFSDDFPPVLFGKVNDAWAELDDNARQAEAERLLDVLWSTYGVRDGYLHRGGAVVVQYWNKHVILVRK